MNGVVEIPLPVGASNGGSGPPKRRNRTSILQTFVAGPENRLVHVAVQSVLNDVEDGYSPIVFYGPSGTGKSHLALGLACAWKARFRGRPLVYVPAVDFARELADAIHTKTVDEFSARYRRVSLLVFEDVGYLEGKPAAQRELISALDMLADGAGRAVLTSSRLPTELAGLAPALRSRLAAGLAVPVAPPGPDARLVILHRLASTHGVNLSDRAAQMLALGFDGTVPELSATLSQLKLSAGAGAIIDAETARRYLAERNGSQKPSLHRIALATARYFALRLADLKSASRRRVVATARGVAMYLARNLTTESLDQIGQYFGSRDHTTVSYNCHKTEERLQTEPEIRDAVLALQESLKSG